VGNGNTGLGTTNPNNLLTVGAYNSATSAQGFKQSLFSTDNMQLSQLEGGAYFGRVAIKEQQLALNNYGNTWVAKENARHWGGVAISSDGKIQTAIDGGNAGYSGQIYISINYGDTWTAKESVRQWNGVAMSSDGKIQTAVVLGDYIYISNDYGNTWTVKGNASSWYGVAMSSDGKIQTAVGNTDKIYISTNYGNNWIAKDSVRNWRSVAMSSDGKIQTAVADSAQVFVSTDYGNTWVAKDSVRAWSNVAMSSDGKIQTAVVINGQIYVSTDYGNIWTAKDSSRYWTSVAMSSDGKIQTAVVLGSYIYISNDYGNSWTAKSSSINWSGVAMSSDGKIQTATVGFPGTGQIYVSRADSYLPSGNFGIGTSTPASALHIASAPTASANYGTLSLGGAAFDGATTGKFVGSATGTSLAINEASTYTGNLIDSQLAGVSKFKVDYTGAIYSGNVYSSSIAPQNNNSGMSIQFRATNSATDMLTLSSGTYTNTTGTLSAVKIMPTYNQAAATGINYDLWINRTETSISSGVQRLISAGTGGATYSEKFAVANNGQTTIGTYNSATSAQGFKQSLFSTDNMQLSQLEGGAYFGRTAIREQQLALNNYGNIWVAKDSSRYWSGIAMSSDGKIQTAVVQNGQIYISTDYGNTWNAKDSPRNWKGVAMNSDGKIQTAVVNNGYIYVSTDYGNTWTAKDSSRSWQSIAMNSDGKIQTAGMWSGQIYISSDYGNTWVAKDSSRMWFDVAMSSDGKIQTGVILTPGFIYVSTDYGNTWTAKDSSRTWYAVAMSSDGKIQTAAGESTQIYVSNDYGNTWTAKDSVRVWHGIAMSSDGKIQTATDQGGQIYISTDYGNTWTAKESARNWFYVAMSSDGKVQTAVVGYSGAGQIYVSNADSYLPAGNFALGTDSPSAQLHTTGTVRFASLGSAGANLTTDANGNVTASSDERLKNIAGTFDKGVEALMNISPIAYHWNTQSGLDTKNTYYGFSAQNIQQSIPEAVGVDSKGFLTLSDRPILATVVNAIKEQQMELNSISNSQFTISNEFSSIKTQNENLILKTDSNINTIAQLQTSIDEQLKKVNNQFTNIEKTQTDSQQILANLQTQIDQIKTLTASTQIELLTAKTDLNSADISLLKQILGITQTSEANITLTGSLTANGINTPSITITNIDPKARTLGTETIKAGQTNIVVETNMVGLSTKIFASIESEIPLPVSITNKIEKKSFEIRISEIQTEDVLVNWWIVEEK
jgi:archaellum component FlaC